MQDLTFTSGTKGPEREQRERPVRWTAELWTSSFCRRAEPKTAHCDDSANPTERLRNGWSISLLRPRDLSAPSALFAYPRAPSELSCLAERGRVLLRDVRVVVIAPLAEGSRAQLNGVRHALVAEGMRLPAPQEVGHLLGVRHWFSLPSRSRPSCALRCRQPVFVDAQHILNLMGS